MDGAGRPATSMAKFHCKTLLLVLILCVIINDQHVSRAYGVGASSNDRDLSTFRSVHSQKTSSSSDSSLFTSSRMNYPAITVSSDKSYSEFYAHQPANVPGASNEDIKRYDGELQHSFNAEEARFSQQDAGNKKQDDDQILLLDRLWNGLRKGRLDPSKRETSHTSQSLKSQMSSLLHSGSVVEIGSGMTVLDLAPSHQNRTYLAVTTQGVDAEILTKAITKQGISNLYLGHLTSDDLITQADLLYSDHQVLFSNLLLSNISTLVGSLLPHEFEELIGKLLTLSANTLVANLVTVDDMQLAYFQDNWESVSEFLRKVCHVAQLSCELYTGLGDDWDGGKTQSVVRVAVTRGTRVLPEKLCSALMSQTQCWLSFGRDYSRPIITSSDGMILLAPVVRNAFSLDLLCELGCSQLSQEQIFHRALMLPHSSHFTPRSLIVTGEHLTLQLNKPSHARIDVEVETADVEQLAAAQAEQKLSNVKAVMTGETVVKSQISTTSTAAAKKGGHRSKLLQPTEDGVKVLSSMAKLPGKRQELSQLEGVVQQLERVDGDGEHVGLIHDERQAEHLSRHWDREHDVVDPVQAQEQAALSNLNSAWEREKPQETYSESKSKFSSNFSIALNKSPQDTQAGNSDAILRKDEKDLRQAMGFLHGNSNVRDLVAHMAQNIGAQSAQQLVETKPLHYKQVYRPPDKSAQDLSMLKLQEKKQSANNKMTGKDRGSTQKPTVISRNESMQGVHGQEQQPKSNDATISAAIGQNSRRSINQGVNEETVDDAEAGGKGVYDDEYEDESVYTYDEEEDEKEDGEMEAIAQGFVPLPAVELSLDADADDYDDHQQLNAAADAEAGEMREDDIEEDMPPVVPPADVVDRVSPRHAARSNSNDIYLDKADDLLQDTNLMEYSSDRKNQHLQDILSDLDMDERQHKKPSFDRNSDLDTDQVARKQGDNDIGAAAGRVKTVDDYTKIRSPLVREDHEEPLNRDFDDGTELKFEPWQNGPPDVAASDTERAEHLVEEANKQYHKGQGHAMTRHLATTVGLTSTSSAPPGGHPIPPQELQSPPQRSEKITMRRLMTETVPGQKTRSQSDSKEGRSSNKWAIKNTLSDIAASQTDNMSSTQAAPASAARHVAPQGSHGMPSIFGPLEVDERIYDQQWKQLQPEFTQGPANFSIFIYGSLRHGLLGLKLARTHPHANLLTLLPTSHQLTKLSHLRKMGRSMSVGNNMMLAGDLNVLTVHRLYEMPHFTHYQILGVGVFESLLHLRSGFLLHLGKLLTLAHTSYVEVPDPEQLSLIFSLLTRHSPHHEQPVTLKGVIYQALYEVGAEEARVSIIADPPNSHRLATPLKLFKIQVGSLKRKVLNSCDGSRVTMEIRGAGSIVMLDEEAHRLVPLPTISHLAISLQTLLQLGLLTEPKERTRVFLSYLNLPLHNDMCPIHISWYKGSLIYCPPMKCSLTQPTVGQDLFQQHNSQNLVNTLIQEVDSQPFSLMDYGSFQGAAIISLAAKYPNSTFIALVDDNAHLAARLYEKLKDHQLSNVIIANLSLTDNFTSKLLESPDFLRYQLLDQPGFIHLLMTLEKRSQLDAMLGQMIATSVTTFIQLPSDQMFSLAMRTFFPNDYHGDGFASSNKWYLAQEHPSSLYQDTTRRLIGETATAHVNIDVRSEVIAPVTMATTLPSSNLLRIDVHALNTSVNHHFDYQLDGHTRKYTLHCSSENKTHYEVYLVRQKDGFHIPYGQVEVVSLIALLRMGILEPMKAGLYDKFLQLPYYEDMAPWNIVFQAGELRYIDYDTRDYNFNKMVPAAFQVMSMLLNYQRTINDFGHCGPDARILYGLTLVGKCVGGEFQGPCDNSKFPVPCGDYTCRSTYIECLQVLNELEHKKRFHQGDDISGKDAQTSAGQHGSDNLWSFGHAASSHGEDKTIFSRMREKQGIDRH